MRHRRVRPRKPSFEMLENRQLMAVAPLHNAAFPQDVDGDTHLSAIDALAVINQLNRGTSATEGEGEPSYFYDVDADGMVTPLDVLSVINALNLPAAPLKPPPPPTYTLPPTVPEPDSDVLTPDDVKTLLSRASMATDSQDAIIAVVDRAGKILGVRTEQGVIDMYVGRENTDLVFAIDGAVSLARTAASFSNNEAPLTSRTIRFISQSTITQREVESNPNITDADSVKRGPGFVAPIGVGGHFPPEVSFTPLVDLLEIEHQGRDSMFHPGADGIKGTTDDITLNSRFNVDLNQAPNVATKDYLQLLPESYGTQSNRQVYAQNRGFGTLPGGIPLYKLIPGKGPNLVGGIGVFFPGPDGYASHEQGFVPASALGAAGPQSEASRMNAPKALEAEFIAFFAAGGTVFGPPEFTQSVDEFEGAAPPRGLIGGVAGRIDLVGITLEIYGPTPTRANPLPGSKQVVQVGRASHGGHGLNSGIDQLVTGNGIVGDTYLRGQSVPEGWLVNPHASGVDPISAADVQQIINQGIAEADKTRAAIRLDVANGFRPGARTKMVLSVTDSTGEVLGLYRMHDATIFSIDVSVAKARNTAYYASDALQTADQVDADNNGVADVPKNTAFTNRTFRFLAAPRYPTGTDAAPGDFSILTMPGINPKTGENTGIPLPASVYAADTASVGSFDSFNASRNFRDPNNLQNQNGIVFFPGSTPLYSPKNARKLVGGFGVSGDGVDQDDVVTVAGQSGFQAPDPLRADQFFVANVRLPFQKFDRNPRG